MDVDTKYILRPSNPGLKRMGVRAAIFGRLEIIRQVFMLWSKGNTKGS
jgi:hypothetical protein